MATAMNVQKMLIAGVSERAPTANERPSVNEVTYTVVVDGPSSRTAIASPASRIVSPSRRSTVARRSLRCHAPRMMYVSSMPIANATNGTTAIWDTVTPRLTVGRHLADEGVADREE